MSPKERVRINVYKSLLAEEKQKNKRKSYFSLSIFVVGVFAGSVYNFVPRNEVKGFEVKTISKLDKKENTRGSMELIDNYFKNREIETKKEELKADEYFVMNMQA